MVTAPSGTVTFLFTDIQGSTRLWQDNPSAMEIALKRHDEILKKTVHLNEGHVFKTVGDAFCCAFAQALDAVKAALAIQLIIREEEWNTPRPIRVRMSLHTGAARERDNDYFGQPVNRVARIESLAHGGQVVMSRATAELVRDVLPEGVWIEDKGSHRLKDLSRPEEIFQVNHPELPVNFPPLKSMDVLPNNLPAQTTPMIGRESELESIRGLFDKEQCRLVSLVGPGGMGKTRLALQTAADMVDKTRDGTWFVDLTSITQSRDVAQETARVLGISQKSGIDPVESVAEILSDKDILIVLDNFEQVIGAYEVVVAWLKSCPAVRFLVTSREPLNIRGEHVFHVHPLSLPGVGLSSILSQFEATRLFIDRACASKPDFTVNNGNAPVVAEICSRLDGIPLAIELAAARIKLINPKAILKRLDTRLKLLTGGPNDMPERHKTLRACIDWSYDLLSEDERIIYRYLSVFHGGISLLAASAVLQPIFEDELEVLGGIESLVDKSLVFRKPPINDEPFFGILETIGEYGYERLKESEEEESALLRYTGFFLNLVIKADELLDGPEQKAWIDKVSANQENINYSMVYFFANRDSRAVISMTRSLVPFWIMWNDFSICHEWILKALEFCSDSEGQDTAWLTMQLGWLFLSMGIYSKAEDPLKKALELFRTISDDAGEATCMMRLGQIHFSYGDFPEARKYWKESVVISDRIHDMNLSALTHQVIGNIYIREEKLNEARTEYQVALDSYLSCGNERKTAEIYNNIGAVFYLEERFQDARAQYQKAIPLLEKYDNKHYLRYAWSNMGELSLSEKKFNDAIIMFEKVKNISVFKFDHRYTSCAFIGIGEAYIGLGDLELAEHCVLEAMDLVEQFKVSVEMGMAFRVMGDIQCKLNNKSKAESQYTAAIEILEEVSELDEVKKAREGLNKLILKES